MDRPSLDTASIPVLTTVAVIVKSSSCAQEHLMCRMPLTTVRISRVVLYSPSQITT